jgi:SWI/SNF-related matrix-associated actin-dependent regulator 1 of chromatin subfamily A
LKGTPALSRPAELFTQIQAINPNLFSSFHDFGLRYCDGKESRFGWDYSGYSNMNELRILLEEKLLIRREKKDVMQQLPSKIREMVILNQNLVELNTKSLKIASKKMNDNLKGLEKRGALLSYFQETSKAKVKAVCEYVNDLLESDKKFLVFAHHQSLLDEIENVCKENNYGYIRIDGSTNSEKRKNLVDTFQNSEKCLCAILSITAANSGITLTQASLVVFAELFWNPGILGIFKYKLYFKRLFSFKLAIINKVQAEDRVYRIGQKNSVVIQYLCAKGTADDEMWPLVNEKLNVLSKAGLTRENLSEANTINSNKFKDLFDENELQANTSSEDSKQASENKSQKNIENKSVQSNTRCVNQQTIDKLLNGIDLNNFDSPPTKKVKF